MDAITRRPRRLEDNETFHEIAKWENEMSYYSHETSAFRENLPENENLREFLEGSNICALHVFFFFMYFQSSNSKHFQFYLVRFHHFYGHVGTSLGKCRERSEFQRKLCARGYRRRSDSQEWKNVTYLTTERKYCELMWQENQRSALFLGLSYTVQIY